VLESAAPMADVGGCCPVVVPAAPAVGPEPASRDASSLVRFSISALHGPAAAVPIGKTAKAQAPNSNVVIFICFFLPVEIPKKRCGVGFRCFDTNPGNEPTFRADAIVPVPRRIAESATYSPIFASADLHRSADANSSIQVGAGRR